jgi:hypothetical protein
LSRRNSRDGRPGFRIPRIPDSRIPGFQNFRFQIPEFQIPEIPDSRISGFQDFRFQRFQDSRFQNFRFQRFQDSRLQIPAISWIPGDFRDS